MRAGTQGNVTERKQHQKRQRKLTTPECKEATNRIPNIPKDASPSSPKAARVRRLADELQQPIHGELMSHSQVAGEDGDPRSALLVDQSTVQGELYSI